MRRFGFFGGLLLLGAFLRPAATPGPPVAGHAARNPSSPPWSPNCCAPALPPESDPGSAWTAICRAAASSSLPASPAQPGAPARQSPSPAPSQCISKGTKLEFLLASVPDPIHTHLLLYFDRSIESLQWAIGDAGYSFETYWLPWSAYPEKQLLTLADRRQRQLELDPQSAHPGVLIFGRHPLDLAAAAAGPDPLLIVFLVAETPTGGVRTPALMSALAAVGQASQAAGQPVPEIRFVGPDFSGSLRPLAALAQDLLRRDPLLRLRFVSGFVTSREAASSFQGSLAAFQDRASFAVTLENDDRASRLFRRYVQSKLAWFLEPKVALLSEDETLYGAAAPAIQAEDDDHRWLLIRYPRQIARLRNAAAESAAGESSEPSNSSVQFTLKDAAEEDGERSEKDSPSVFSRLQSPASQQAALLEIASVVRSEHVDYAGVLSTDVLDELFLSRFLRDACSATRVFTLDADLLFTTETQDHSLAGLLAVTNYPLISRNQHWTGASLKNGVPRRVVFSSRYAEATYNAARILLQRDVTPWNFNARGDYLLEYSMPLRPPENHPPLWLTVLGRDAYWPVALLDAEEHPPASTLFPSPYPPPLVEDLHPETPSRGWYLALWLVSGLALLHCVYVFYLLCLPARQAPDVKVGQGNQPPRIVHALRFVFPAYVEEGDRPSGHQVPYLLAITCVLFCLQFTLFIGTWPLYASHLSFSSPAQAAQTLGVVILLALAFVASALIARGFRQSVQSRAKSSVGGNAVTNTVAAWNEYWYIPVTAVPLAAVYCIVLSLLACQKRYEAGYFFAYRSLHLSSGVSPVMPLLLLAVAYFHWCWIQLRREQLLHPREILRDLRRQDNSTKATPPAGISAHMESAEEIIQNVFANQVWMPAAACLAVWVFALLQPWITLQSVEWPSYDAVYSLVLAGLYWLVAVCWTQFLWSWRAFRVVLQRLETDPCRNAFSRLRKEIASVPLVNKPREHQFFFTARCGDTLTAIQSFEQASLTPEDRTALRALKDRVKALAQDVHDTIKKFVTEPESSLWEDENVYPRLQLHLDQIGEIICDHLNETAWKDGDSDSLRRESEPPAVRPRRLTAAERLRILEEEFVAMRYLIYMRSVFRHLRNFLGFVVGGFVFIVLSLYSYPFEGRRWIGYVCMLTLLQFGIGIGIVFAQMDKDAILSRITDTRENQLGRTFFLRMAQFGALPLLALLTAQFPAINRLVLPWLRPALEALK